MKKIILITLIVNFIATISFSQIIEIRKPGTNEVYNSHYLHVEGSPNQFSLSKYLWVHNVSANDETVYVRREEINVAPNTKNATCWFICPPSFNSGDSVDWTSPYEVEIPAGGYEISFASHLEPQGVSGCSHFRYYFYDRNLTYTDTVDIYFSHGAPCDDVVSNNIFEEKLDFKVYPNPANNQVNITLNLSQQSKGKLSIINVLGQELFTKEITQKNNQLTDISLNAFEAGLYFVTFVDDNNVISTKKLQIVK